MSKETKRTVLSVALIIVLGFAVYGNSLKGEFIWDDERLIEDNAYIKDFSFVSKIFTENIRAGAGKKGSFFRPLQMLSYMVDYKLWNLNVFGYHLTNTILHVLAGISVYFLVFILFKDAALSLLTSLLFISHPVHVEAVGYISGRADALAGLFMLLSLIFYIRYINLKKVYLYIISLLCFMAALLSKELSIIFFGALLLYHYSFKEKADYRKLIPIAAITFFYILIRLVVLRSLLIMSSSAAPAAFIQRLPGFFAALVNYFKILMLPLDLHMEYGYPLFFWFDTRVIAGVLLFFLLIGFVVRNRKKGGIVLFSIGWFFTFLLPHSNLYSLNAYMAEHWLYLPSIGFFLIVANFFIRILRSPSFKRFQRITLAVFIILIGFYSVLTIRQNIYWQTPLTFYTRTLKYAPESSRVHNNLGKFYGDRKDYEQAFVHLRKAIEINPRLVEAYYNIANTYNATGDYEKAVDFYKKAIDIDPGFTKVYSNLGVVYDNLGQYAQAIEAYAKAIDINPSYAKAYANLGVAYEGLGKTDKAIGAYKKAMEIDPGLVETYYNLGLIYYNGNNLKEALALFKKAIDLNPNLSYVHYNLANLYYDMKQYPAAEEAFLKSIELEPGNADLYNNLANTYKAQGKIKQAIDSYKKAIELEPSCATAHNNLALAYYHNGQYNLAVIYVDKALELGYKVSPEFLEALTPYRNE